jgi:hypothetical protein
LVQRPAPLRVRHPRNLSSGFGRWPLLGRLEGANFAPGVAAMMVVAATSPRSTVFENGAVERKPPIPPYGIELVDEFKMMGRRFVACFVASGSSHAMRSDNRGSKMTAGERWSMWCRLKKLLLLKTDQTPLVSARSCVSALASQASSFHVRFAPDSNGNADIAEGQSWANKRLMHCSNYRPSRSPRRRGRAASPAFQCQVPSRS